MIQCYLISGEMRLNILVIKIYLGSNNNISCVETTVVNLFYFLHFRKVIGAIFLGFILQTQL